MTMSYPPHPPPRSVTPISTAHLNSTHRASPSPHHPRRSSSDDHRRSPVLQLGHPHRPQSSQNVGSAASLTQSTRRPSPLPLSSTQPVHTATAHLTRPDIPFDSYSSHSPRSPVSPFSPFPLPSPFSPSPSSNFRVAVRVRPPHPHEVSAADWRETVQLGEDGRSLTLLEGDASPDAPLPAGQVYHFDAVFGPDSTQHSVYEQTARDAVQSVLQGYNATVLAYGQTGTGKTFTMEGFDSADLRGLIPRAVSDLFHLIQSSSSSQSHFLVRASYIQIYNENITDLLMASNAPSAPSNLLIREDKVRGVFVGGLSEWVARNTAEVMSLLKRGSAHRATAATRSNETSSRSHAVFMLNVEQNNAAASASSSPASFLSGKLNLVDLAGSERISVSGTSGQRLEETRSINQSLSALANVISALIKHRPHVPYRDSKLTRLLQSSIGGNTKTTLLAMLSPAPQHHSENVSTLAFASRARRVENRVEVNEGQDGRSLLRRYERELARLRGELKERGENVVDARRLMRVAEEKRRVEEDKAEALQRVKALSESLMREKALKRALEATIEDMNGRMLVGGGSGGAEMEEKVRELEERWEEVEKEREALMAEKEKSGQMARLVDQQREVIRRMTAVMEEKERERRDVESDRDQWRDKCRMLEDAYDTLETRFLRIQQRAGGEHEEDDPEDADDRDGAERDGAQGGRLAVIVTPWDNEDSTTREDDDGAHDDRDVDAVPMSGPAVHRSITPRPTEAIERAEAERRQRREDEERDALIVILDKKMKVGPTGTARRTAAPFPRCPTDRLTLRVALHVVVSVDGGEHRRPAASLRCRRRRQHRADQEGGRRT